MIGIRACLKIEELTDVSKEASSCKKKAQEYFLYSTYF